MAIYIGNTLPLHKREKKIKQICINLKQQEL